MTNTNDGGPAYPVIPPVLPDGHPPAGYPYPDSGMTLRDWFAGQLLASVMAIQARHPPDPAAIAMAAYKMADAMLRAREAGR